MSKKLDFVKAAIVISVDLDGRGLSQYVQNGSDPKTPMLDEDLMNAECFRSVKMALRFADEMMVDGTIDVIVNPGTLLEDTLIMAQDNRKNYTAILTVSVVAKTEKEAIEQAIQSMKTKLCSSVAGIGIREDKEKR